MNTQIATQGLAALLLALAASAGAHAATSAQTLAQYQLERAACLNGQSHQDRSTCMREVGAAWAEARRGGLGTTGSTDYQANATARCNAQPSEDRDACKMRALGQGKVQGSVNGGGLIREVETLVK